VHFKNNGEIVAKGKGKASFVVKLYDRCYPAADSFFKKIDTVFSGPVKFLGERKARERRVEAGPDEKRPCMRLKPEYQLVFILTETLRDHRTCQLGFKGFTQVPEKIVIVVHNGQIKKCMSLN
jgi:hypothetical protein